MELGQIIALIGAALAVVMGGIGSAYGVRIAGQATAGVVAENDEAFGKCLVLQVLPGTQGIYGFLIGFILLIKTNVLGGMIALTTQQGWAVFVSCLPIAIVGLISAVYQGMVASAAIGMVGRNAEASGKGIVMTVMVETYAVLALLASFLMVWFII